MKLGSYPTQLPRSDDLADFRRQLLRRVTIATLLWRAVPIFAAYVLPTPTMPLGNRACVNIRTIEDFFDCLKKNFALRNPTPSNADLLNVLLNSEGSNCSITSDKGSPAKGILCDSKSAQPSTSDNPRVIVWCEGGPWISLSFTKAQQFNVEFLECNDKSNVVANCKQKTYPEPPEKPRPDGDYIEKKGFKGAAFDINNLPASANAAMAAALSGTGHSPKCLTCHNPNGDETEWPFKFKTFSPPPKNHHNPYGPQCDPTSTSGLFNKALERIPKDDQMAQRKYCDKPVSNIDLIACIYRDFYKNAGRLGYRRHLNEPTRRHPEDPTRDRDHAI